MPGPTTESLDADVKELRGDVHRVAIDLAGLKAEVGIFKWLLGLTLVATLSGLASTIWWASATNTRLGAMEGRFDKLEVSIAKAIGQASKGQVVPR